MTAQRYAEVGGWGKKLTKRQAVALQVDLSNGMTKTTAALKYGISRRTVNRILSDAPRLGYPLKPCGTNAAYERHRKNGEPPCAACCAAHAAKYKEWKDRKREEKS